jgi:hypothetical protein
MHLFRVARRTNGLVSGGQHNERGHLGDAGKAFSLYPSIPSSFDLSFFERIA